MNGEILLTLQQVAELENKTYAALKMKIMRGKLNGIKIETGVKCGFEYRIPISELSDTAQKKYFAGQKITPSDADLYEVTGKQQPRPASLEQLTAAQREDAYFWESVLRDWHTFAAEPKTRTEMTKLFVENFNANHDRKISVRTLYDKNKLYKDYGVAGLADGRMAHEKKGRQIDEKLWSVFTQWYLDENKRSISYLYTILQKWSKKENPDIVLPSEATIRRAVSEIPDPVIKYFREGNKAFEDQCLPYIVRTYENITSNEYWSSDYHSLDLMVRDDVTGEVYRPHLVPWIDIRSRKVLSLRMRRSSDSDGQILAFRDAAVKYGLPDNVYLDNGREFLVHDFGGRGKRKTDENADYGTSMLERLGIRMVNAKVRNGKAKVIERSFKQVSDEFSRLFITYCGNRPENRPERHNSVLKNIDNIPLASEVLKDLTAYIEGMYNQDESEAEGLKGLSPNECYEKNLITKRALTSDQANIMLLRSSRLQSVSREGVFVTVGQKKVWFFDADFVSAHKDQKVYVRFDPDKLDAVRVYDKHEVFMAVLDRLPEGGYEGADDTEAIKYVNAEKRKVTRAVKAFVENQREIMDAPDLRGIVMDIARENIERDNRQYEASILNISFQTEKEELFKTAVGDAPIVDFNKMINNAKKKKGE